jgi:hypothetical protein
VLLEKGKHAVFNKNQNRTRNQFCATRSTLFAHRLLSPAQQPTSPAMALSAASLAARQVTGSLYTFDFNKPVFEQNLPLTYPPESRNAADPAALANLFNSTSCFAYFTRAGAVNRFAVSVDRLPTVYDNGTFVSGQGERLYFPATEKFISFTFGGGLGWTRKLVPSGKAGIPAGTTLRVSLSLVDLSSKALPVGPERRIFETAFQGTSQLPVPNSTILYTTVLNPCRSPANFDPSTVRRALALVQTAVLDPAPAKPPTWAELDQYGSFDFSYAITMSDPVSLPYVNGSILLKNETRNPGILVPGGGLAAAQASFGARVSPNYPHLHRLSLRPRAKQSVPLHRHSRIYCRS